VETCCTHPRKGRQGHHIPSIQNNLLLTHAAQAPGTVYRVPLAAICYIRYINHPETKTMKTNNGKLESARQELGRLWDAGDYRAALKLAASWPRLAHHKDRIQRGWSAATNPEFYREIEQDPDRLYRAGLAAVAERYGLALPTNVAATCGDTDGDGDCGTCARGLWVCPKK